MPQLYYLNLCLAFSCFVFVVGRTNPSSLKRMHDLIDLRGGESSNNMDTTSASVPAASAAAVVAETGDQQPSKSNNHLDVVFSDLDGTLLHYPENPNDVTASTKGVVQLPPSSTGMVGILSAETLRLCREIRQCGVKFVLVSGMRMATMLKRLPYLPKADAYCCEAGGRIFFPSSSKEDGAFLVEPKSFEGSLPSDLEPFYLKEDMEWRSKMDSKDAAGKDGYIGNNNMGGESAEIDPIPLDLREGALWEHARKLTVTGLAPDIKGYSTCFRVNRKHQNEAETFDALLEGETIPCPPTLATSTNLGCVDFYPASSGKLNCCAYLARKFSSSPDDGDPLETRCVCLCDDDNDIDMALACLHAYIPMTSSESMVETIREYPTKFTLTASADDSIGQCTRGTEKALSLVLDRIHGS